MSEHKNNKLFHMPGNPSKKAIIANIEEIYKFADKIKTMPECKNLTSEEKLKIIFSYPFKLKIV